MLLFLLGGVLFSPLKMQKTIKKDTRSIAHIQGDREIMSISWVCCTTQNFSSDLGTLCAYTSTLQVQVQVQAFVFEVEGTKGGGGLGGVG